MEPTPAPAVLIVDDEDLVRHLCVRILSEAGFRVSEARNGLEALEQLHQACPDLMITDSSMPKVGGAHLIAEARSRFPDLAILRISGSFGASGVRDRLPPDVVTLDKPFANETFLAAVRRLLPGDPAGGGPE